VSRFFRFFPEIEPGLANQKELEIESTLLDIIMRVALQRVTKGRVTIEGRIMIMG